jgi:hypothetical protein
MTRTHKEHYQTAGKITVISVAWLMAVTAYADEGVIADFFRGSEMKTTGIGTTCQDDPGATFPYEVISGLTASVSGGYHFSNAGHHYVSGDTQIAVYTSFDPADPTANRLGWAVADTVYDGGAISLDAGTEYTMVVQSFGCGGDAMERGEWSFVYRGPGQLSGPSIYPLPSYGSGSITGSSPTFGSPACGNVRYEQVGPVRVPVTGDYRYSDTSVHFDLDIEVYFYENSFDPNDPETNIIRFEDDGGTVALEEGTDYYLVIVPFACQEELGDYQMVLLGPSGEFVITEGVNGAWINLETLGQGQLVDVYPDSNTFFSAWFTWDITQPGPEETADVGDPNHRWFTASGGYQGDTATLDVYLASGGLFDDPAPVENNVNGTMTMRFLSCSEAEVTYNVGEYAGSFTANKIAGDNNATCEMLMEQHKVPVQ